MNKKEKTGNKRRNRRQGAALPVPAVILALFCLAASAGCGLYVPDESVKMEAVSETSESGEIQVMTETPPEESAPENQEEEAAEEEPGKPEDIPDEPSLSGEPEPREETTIVCIGDSITYGTGLADPDTQSYPVLLEGMLGEGFHVINLGKPGYTLMDSTLCYTQDPVYQEALSYAADIYLFMLGTNDAYASFWDAEKYRAALEQVILDLRGANPETEIYLMIPPHCFLREEEMLISDAIIGLNIAPIMEEIAENEDTDLIDLYSITEGRWDLYCQDMIHPNAQGAYVIADTVYQSFSAKMSL